MQEPNEFTKAYLICALWLTLDDDGEPLDHLTLSDIAPKAVDLAVKDCAAFVERAGALLEGIDNSQAGHDFWLTRNGHGAGFWDRGLGEIGEKLTKLSEEFRKIDPIVGDDGKVYFE